MPNKWISALGLVIVGFVAFFLYQKYRVAPQLKITELDLVDLDGKKTDLSSFAGKKMVICFSASWCGACRKELEEINSLNKVDRYDIEFVVISDEPREKVRAFKEKNGYPFTFLKMNKAFSEIGIHSIPTSYFVNKKLEVKKETVGYIDWSDPSTREHLRRLMEQD